MRKFAGIGSRKVPEQTRYTINAFCHELILNNYILRSGGAGGMDEFFESYYRLAKGTHEIFLPWKGFNNNDSSLWIESNSHEHEVLLNVAKRFHPHWEKLSREVRLLMCRNCQQVLGRNLDDPVDFVICWTPDGCESNAMRSKATGGTGQAISIADAIGAPVYNISNPSSHERVWDMIMEMRYKRENNQED